MTQGETELAGTEIAVTGANGFLGRYICQALRSRGANVIGVVRSLARASDLEQSGVDLRQADLLNEDALASALRGASGLINSAGLVVPDGNSDYFKTNVEGTENLMRAANSACVKRIVHVSSVSVYRRHAPEVAEDDERKTDPGSLRKDPYGVSKAQGEDVAWRLARRHDLQLSVVRPGYMYGIGGRFFDGTRRAFAGPVALVSIFTRIPLAYAADVAEAIVRCLERPHTIGQTYNLTGDESATWHDFAEAWEAVGGPMARIKLPVPRPLHHSYKVERAKSDLDWSNRDFASSLREILETEIGH